MGPVLVFLAVAFALVGSSSRAARGEGLDIYHEEWRWTRFTEADGLALLPAIQIVEGPQHVWAMTHGGLCRYDGWHWEVVASARDLEVLSIDVDRAGVVWLGTLQGPYRWDGTQFVRVELPSAELHAVGAVAPLDDGSVVFVASNLQLGEWEAYRWVEGRVESYPELAARAPTKVPICFRGTGGRVFVDAGHTLYEVDGDDWHPIFVVEDDTADPAYFEVGVDGQGIASFWSPPELIGLWEWEAEGAPRRVESEGRGVVRGGDISKDGEAIVVYESGEVRVRRDGVWSSLSPVPEPFRSAVELRFREDGDLWVSAKSGLYLFHRVSSLWSHHRVGEVNSAWNRIFELQPSRSGDVWAATSAGVLRIGTPVLSDGQRHRSLTRLPSLPEVDVPGVTSVGEASDGRVWAGSTLGFAGLRVWDGASWTTVLRDATGAVLPAIRRVSRDRSGGLWFLAYDVAPGGSLVFRLEGDAVVPWAPAAALGEEAVAAFLEDSSGRYWLGTAKGVARFDGTGWREWEIAAVAPFPTYTLAEAPDGSVWCGRQMQRLGRVRNDDVFETFDPGPFEVRAMDFDEIGRAWTIAMRGLEFQADGYWLALDPAAYMASAGLTSLLLVDGHVLVGSRGSGLYELDRAGESTPPPQIQLAPPIADSENLDLSWTVASWWADQRPDRIQNRYRLGDAPWSDWNPDRRVAIVRPPAGPQVFEIQVRNRFGTLRTESVPVEVPRHWMRTPFFWTPLSVLLLASGILGASLVRQRRREARRIRERDGLLRSIAAQSRDVIWVGELGSDRILFMNPAWRDIWGGEGAEALTSDRSAWRNSVHPEDHAEVERHHGVVASGRAAALEYRIVRPDGAERWIRDRAFPVRREDGGIQVMVGFVEDVTERRRREEEERTREELQRRALVQEVHHRIKNTLQGVVGLLENHIAEKPDLRPSLEAAVLQISAVATVHGLHSKHDELLLADLLDAIKRHVELTAGCRVAIEGGPATERLRLSGGDAVPVALVVNEIVFNAAKHARPEGPREIGRPGVAQTPIRVEVQRDGDGAWIEVTNPGALPAGLDLEKGTRLGTGLALVRLLVPRGKAELAIEQRGDHVRARLRLGASLVTTVPAVESAESAADDASALVC